METKKRIMDAAFRLFAEEGNGFSLTEVANEVGIQKASIYAHFQGKEALLYAVFDREINEYFCEINEKSNDLHDIFNMILNYYGKSATKLVFWKRALLFPPKEFENTLTANIKEQTKQRYDIIKDIINKGIDDGFIRPLDSDAAATSFLSMIHGYLSFFIIYDFVNPLPDSESIWQNFWNGIKGETL